MTIHKKFGTFLGVYTPSILTILGLIMYLRFGWVVGNLGLGLTILVVCMASSITFITGLSASAIATNLQVGVGGEYFLVSRSLGIEFGGAIGIPLYLCRTLSITFYSFGLAEAIIIFWPASWGAQPVWAIQALAAFIIIAITILSGKSASLVLKAQIPIMILVGLSIVALMVGVFSHDLRTPEWSPSYRTAPEGFWYVFAVFFPAVTGFTAGVGMSGDLKDPRKSIPKGTMGAVVSGLIIYLIIPILLSVTAILTLDQLASADAGLGTWTKIAFMGGLLIYPAVWGAILSSAFGSILGGPRVLQALSMDGLAPKFLSQLSPSGQPTYATWISGFIAVIAVSLGNLNTIAQFVSVLFLTLYVAINMSAALEQLVAEPSYRPQIKVPWYISILGAIGAIVVMYLINPWACLLAFILEALIMIFLRKRSLEQKWGDVGAGFWMGIARFALLRVGKLRVHPRNWRPLMLLFVKDIKERELLVRLAESLGQNRGILSISKMLLKDGEFHSDHKKDIELAMQKDLQDLNLQAFCEVNPVQDLHRGIINVSKGHGIAGLKTNTVVFGWSEEEENQVQQMEIFRDLAESRHNIILVRFDPSVKKLGGDLIDIWWAGQESNGDLMLLCAYLLKLNEVWEKAKIRIHSIVRNFEEKGIMEAGIRQLLPLSRIDAEINIILNKKGTTFKEILMRESSSADLVFLGLMRSEMKDAQANATRIKDLSQGLKTAVFVQNNSIPGTVPILLRL